MTKLRYTLCYHRKAIIGWLLAVIAALLIWTVAGEAQKRALPEDVEISLIQEELAEHIAQIFISIADEDTRNDAFCADIGGQREVRHD